MARESMVLRRGFAHSVPGAIDASPDEELRDESQAHQSGCSAGRGPVVAMRTHAGQRRRRNGEKTLRAQVRAALGRALRCDPDRLGIHLENEGGVLVLKGEVPDIAAKKRVLEEIAAMTESRRVADRLRVAPAVRMSDDAIRAHVK